MDRAIENLVELTTYLSIHGDPAFRNQSIHQLTVNWTHAAAGSAPAFVNGRLFELSVAAKAKLEHQTFEFVVKNNDGVKQAVDTAGKRGSAFIAIEAKMLPEPPGINATKEIRDTYTRIVEKFGEQFKRYMANTKLGPTSATNLIDTLEYYVPDQRRYELLVDQHKRIAKENKDSGLKVTNNILSIPPWMRIVIQPY